MKNEYMLDESGEIRKWTEQSEYWEMMKYGHRKSIKGDKVSESL